MGCATKNKSLLQAKVVTPEIEGALNSLAVKHEPTIMHALLDMHRFLEDDDIIQKATIAELCPEHAECGIRVSALVFRTFLGFVQKLLANSLDKWLKDKKEKAIAQVIALEQEERNRWKNTQRPFSIEGWHRENAERVMEFGPITAAVEQGTEDEMRKINCEVESAVQESAKAAESGLIYCPKCGRVRRYVRGKCSICS